MGPKGPNRGSRRTHVLGGCQSCRKRHQKCDQVRPKCLTCQAVGIECQGYDTSIQWVFHDGSESFEDKRGTRRHLYTEQARRSMSQQLANQVDAKSVDVTLSAIDSWSGDLESSTLQKEDELKIGPFRVINFSLPENHLECHMDALTPVLTNSTIDSNQATTFAERLHQASPSSQGLAASVPDYLQWSDLFDLEFETWLGAQPDDFGLESAQSQQTQLHADCVEPLNAQQTIHDISTSSIVIIDDLELREQAPTLIKHFSENVIDAIRALPLDTKSPYETLHVANAVQTLARTTYLEKNLKHANAANFYSVLACSAYHLSAGSVADDLPEANVWGRLAERAGLKAKEHLQKSLQTETSGLGKAKYKDQLMALICALTFSVMSGKPRDIRAYMLDAEKLLRMRGLAKRHISRRARLLHHMYTWHRIIGESTYVLHDLGSHLAHLAQNTGSQVPTIHVEKGHSARLDDFLRIERPDEHDHDVGDQKDDTSGLHDIHLQDPRAWQGTLYLQIYGLPETWLSLLSQTTRLANVAEMHKFNTGNSMDEQRFRRTLDRRAARLEDMICRFAAQDSPISQSLTDTPPSYYMLQALNSSLVIYFYRRIREVNSLILGQFVNQVVTALQCFDVALAQHNIKGPGTPWPAFIAGCEARSGSGREYLKSWLDKAFDSTGLQPYRVALNVMSEVWALKDFAATQSVPGSSSTPTGSAQIANSWIEVCRSKEQWVVLC